MHIKCRLSTEIGNQVKSVAAVVTVIQDDDANEDEEDGGGGGQESSMMAVLMASSFAWDWLLFRLSQGATLDWFGSHLFYYKVILLDQNLKVGPGVAQPKKKLMLAQNTFYSLSRPAWRVFSGPLPPRFLGQ